MAHLSQLASPPSAPFTYQNWFTTFSQCYLKIFISTDLIAGPPTEFHMAHPAEIMDWSRQTESIAKIHKLPPPRYLPCAATLLVVGKEIGHFHYLVGASLRTGVRYNKYVHVITYNHWTALQVLRNTVKDPNNIIDYSRLHIIQLDQSVLLGSSKDALFKGAQVNAVCHNWSELNLCSVSNSVQEPEDSRRSRLKLVSYFPYALMPFRGQSSYEDLYTNYPEDSVEVKTNKEVLRAIFKHVGNTTVDLRTVDKSKYREVVVQRAQRMQMTSSHLNQPHSTYIPIHQGGFSFISCAKGENPIRSFEYFASPFGTHVWLSVLGSCAILSILFFKCLKVGKTYTDTLGALLFLFFDQHQEITMLPKKRFASAMLIFGLLIGTWQILALILSNAYRGVITSNVAAPPPASVLETFDQLLEENFTLYSAPVTGVRAYALERDLWEMVVSKYHEIMSQIGQPSSVADLTDFGHALKRFLYVFDNTPETDKKFHSSANLARANKYRKYQQMVRFPAHFPTVSIEDVLANCSEKTAYVDYEYNLEEFEPRKGLETKWRDRNGQVKLKTGKELVLNEQEGWTFIGDFQGGYLLSTAVRRLTAESGVLNWLRRRLNAFGRKTSLGFLWKFGVHHATSLGLEANLIQGLFLIYFFVLAAAVLAFIYELVTQMCLWILRAMH